ncbi:MAG: hypothetical protein HYR96_05520 [Deltaproteobacteria bacterium]|nr:hypothetical protein [Deltaproteobacteria bacterium]MBI3294864.1 hypothetical protein [Deltaproteobacteria bacterium]
MKLIGIGFLLLFFAPAFGALKHCAQELAEPASWWEKQNGVANEMMRLAQDAVRTGSDYISDPGGNYSHPRDFLRNFGHLSGTYWSLAGSGSLLSQTDERLKTLVRDQNARLCATASLVNAVLAVRIHFQHSFWGTQSAAQWGRATAMEVINEASTRFGKDVRRGMYLDIAKEILGSQFKKAGLADAVEVSRYALWYQRNTRFDLSMFFRNRNTILIASFYDPDSDSYHAVNLIDYNPTNREVFFSDPYQPNSLWHLKATSGWHRGKPTVQLRLPQLGHPDALLDEVIAITLRP